MPDLEDLLERVKGATGPDRETDLAIHLAVEPDGEIARFTKYRRGWDGKEGYAWDIYGGSVCFENIDASGRCTHNGGVPLPRYTRSLDAVVALCERVLPGTRGSVDFGFSEYQRAMGITPDGLPFDGAGATAPLALLAAILTALIEKRDRVGDSRSPSLVGE